MKDSLQSYLDEIDNSYFVSECEVLSSLSDEYDKSVLLLEYYQGNDLSSFQLFVMEGETEKKSDDEEDNRSIWEKAAGDKNEHIILRILQYIPRLLKEFWKWLTKEKSDPNKKEGTKRGFKSLEERINVCKSEADFEKIFEGCKNLTIKVVQGKNKGLIDAKPEYVTVEYYHIDTKEG